MNLWTSFELFKVCLFGFVIIAIIDFTMIFGLMDEFDPYPTGIVVIVPNIRQEFSPLFVLQCFCVYRRRCRYIHCVRKTLHMQSHYQV